MNIIDGVYLKFLFLEGWGVGVKVFLFLMSFIGEFYVDVFILYIGKLSIIVMKRFVLGYIVNVNEI